MLRFDRKQQNSVKQLFFNGNKTKQNKTKKKNLPAMQETWVQFSGRENPLEKEMSTHSSILAWRIPWREEPGGLQSKGSQELDMTE